MPTAAAPGIADQPDAAQARRAHRGIWSDLSMETGIATLVCYAGVFGDVVAVDEIAARLGAADQEEFQAALDHLRRTDRIIVQDGFAGLPGFEEQIRLKPTKIELANRLINARRADLERLARNPLVRFVGVSGSLAAQNPIPERDADLDVDIFLITRNQCLWLYLIPRSFLTPIFPDRANPRLCINYVMDESSLEVANKNIFTATEIRNLVPLARSDAFSRFIHVNRWVDYYYPGTSEGFTPIPPLVSGNLVNRLLYALHTTFRAIKLLDVTPLRRISFRFDPRNHYNYCRMVSPSGGYQQSVQSKFSRLAVKWYPDLVSSALITKLFPECRGTSSASSTVEAAGREPSVDLHFESKYG